MQRGVCHRVVSRADPRHRGNIGEFANRRVGDVRQAVAIGVIRESGVDDAAPRADFAIGPKCRVCDKTIGMHMRRVGRKSGHQ